MSKQFLFTVLLFLTFFSFSSAATDDFKVRQRIGIDTIAPTTPTALTATPIAQTQIDLSWGASTDDSILEGYQVYRDAVQIATTTLTTYSDSGLTASTTYTYFVRAFDDSFNYSSSSNNASTTTLPLVATSTPPTPTDNGGANHTDIRLLSFTIVPSLYSVNMAWETSRYAQFELQWGRTSSYELGFVSNGLFKREHNTVITELEPGTVYEYELIAYGHDGHKTVLKTGKFRTLDAPDTGAPTNVSNLQATVEGSNVRLTWDNPLDDDFSYNRIVRSHLFYPTDPFDGFSVYQGAGNSFLDRDALSLKDIQYYTVFSYDARGNISSGAITYAVKGKQIRPLPDATTTPAITIDFRDIEFLQDKKLVRSDDIDGRLPLLVRIAYEKLPEHLKTITVTLHHPTETYTSFSFILKINNDKTYYEALISPLRTVGIYPAVVSIFDYETDLMHAVEGEITVHTSNFSAPIFGAPLSISASDFSYTIFFVLLLLILLLFLLLRLMRAMFLKEDVFVVFGGAHSIAATFVLVFLIIGAYGFVIFENQSQDIEGGITLAASVSSAVQSTGLYFPMIAVCVIASIAVLASFMKKK